jgi:hypothetical protein
VLAIFVTAMKVVQLDDSDGDDAMFMQLTHNVGPRGVGRSQVAGTNLDFVARGLAPGKRPRRSLPTRWRRRRIRNATNFGSTAISSCTRSAC